MTAAVHAPDRPSLAGIWWQAIRPATLTAAFGPVAVGTALAHHDGRLAPLSALAALLGAVFIQIGTNLYNDYADFEKGADTDARVGPARAVQKGWLTSGQVLVGTVVSFLLAAAFGLYLVLTAGWPILVLGLVSIACGVLYTGGPAPLAYVGLGDLFVMAFFGVAAVCGTYFVQAGNISPEAWLTSLAVGSHATAILVVNNLRDRHTDREAGKRTLVVRFGERFGRGEYALTVVAPYLLVLGLFVRDGATLASAGWLAPIVTLPLAIGGLRRVMKRDGHDLNPELGATGRLGLLFCLALAIGVSLLGGPA